MFFGVFLLTLATFDQSRLSRLVLLLPSMFYELLEVRKIFAAYVTPNGFSMVLQLMIPQGCRVGEDFVTSRYTVNTPVAAVSTLPGVFLVHIVLMVFFWSFGGKQLATELTWQIRKELNLILIWGFVIFFITVLFFPLTCLVVFFTVCILFNFIITLIIAGVGSVVLIYLIHCTADQVLQNVTDLFISPPSSSMTDDDLLRV